MFPYAESGADKFLFLLGSLGRGSENDIHVVGVPYIFISSSPVSRNNSNHFGDKETHVHLRTSAEEEGLHARDARLVFGVLVAPGHFRIRANVMSDTPARMVGWCVGLMTWF